MLDEQISQLALLFPFVIPVSILLILGFFIKKSHELLDIERGLVPIYKENCGGNFGLLNFTPPMVRFGLYDDFLVIAHFKPIVLNYHEIFEVRQPKQYGKSRVQIIHHSLNAPKRIILQTKNSQQVINLINSKIQNYSYQGYGTKHF